MTNHQPPIPSVYKHIRALRRQLEVSQLDVARGLGISQSQYSLFEQGYVEFPEELLHHVYEILGICNLDTVKGRRANER